MAFISVGRLIMSLQIGYQNTNSDPICTCNLVACLSFTKPNTDYLTPYLYWDIAEVGFSILAICLPAIFQLTQQGKRLGLRSLLRFKKISMLSMPAAEDHRRGRTDQDQQRLWQPDWNNLYEAPFFGTSVSVSANASKDSEAGIEAQRLVPLEGINVRQDISVNIE